MIKRIYFKHYRKLQDFSLDFSKEINVISGENGTCKSSILHIVSNAFQKVDPK
ncbi:TPA: AAA family ATPase, partial [Pasteurella multocida]|nr:AAA family ATPase [Pasteurella multocida]